jgi:anti-sigma factor RsiW
MHLTDDQLNEYLDNESAKRVQIESHLSSCDECTARLAAFQSLFAEIESLPEMTLSKDIAARFTSPPNLIPKLPRWLTLTAILQTALAVIAIILVAPYVTSLLAPYSQQYALPSVTDVWLDLQLSFAIWMQSLGSVSLPEIPMDVFALPAEITPGILMTSVIGMSLIWALGNWWLLHKKTTSFA